jgi:ParB/RepB/Spo0J family partition protein
MGAQNIAVSKIQVNPVALRDVKRDSLEYQELVDSVKRVGILNSISVRKLPDVDGEERFGLVDGLQRFNAAKDAGLEEVPCNVTSLAEAEVLEAQIIANVQKIETKPVEYARALQRVLTQNPVLTMSELSARLSKSPTWLSERLNLTKLIESVSALVNEGKINLTNAFMLAKLPEERQPDYISQAMTMSPGEFIPMLQKVSKEIKDAARAGREPNKEWEPHPFPRKQSEIKAEMQTGEAARRLVASTQTTDPVEAFKLAVKWIMNVDPEGIEIQRQTEKARKEKLEADKAKRAQEREEKKLQEATKAELDLTKV